jgi:Icc-related predicted phosphoesterase
MKIQHISDTHGSIPILEGDIVIHSGDMYPNICNNEEKQKNWFNGVKIDRPFFFCHGNHDYYMPENVIDITNKQVEYKGISIYGFPYVPYIDGDWNYELSISEMKEAVREIPKVDILVSHAPIILDKGMGNNILLNHLFYNDLMPKYFLCGHIHEGAGITEFKDTLISNAACTSNIFYYTK